MKYYIRFSLYPDRWLFTATDSYFPAEPLRDLITFDNTLSFFEIDDENDLTNSIIAGFAMSRRTIEELQYFKIEKRAFQRRRFKFDNTTGDTPSLIANTQHRNMIEISSNDIVRLAKLIYPFSAHDSVQTKTVSEVERAIKDALVDPNDTIDRSMINLDKKTKARLGI